ncbi:MAG TPA: hypothetical protein ENH55_08780 [Aurantimonas coralicida]|uniref:Uncharacterized protein n=2 Tax=root TaxID=1 RepID=A0A9C9TJ91_9HYPH|nr:hypothetical protein [Aurantimonas coralicida]HEU03405.1 hypothetical protein [Aurantimonas coralicida]
MRWAERAKYRYLVERLAGDQPLIPRSQPSAESFDLEDPEGASCYLKREAETAQALQAAGIAVGSGVDLGELDSEADATLIAPAALISAADVAALIEKGVGTAIKRAMARPGSEDLLSSRVPAFIEKKREELGPQAKHLADYPGRIAVFRAIVGDKPIGMSTTEQIQASGAE